LNIPAPKLHIMEPPAPSDDHEDPPRPRRELWKARTLLVLEVLFFVELGVMLAVLPWTPLWKHNPILNSSLPLRQLAESGFVRGLVTGLGLVNLWIAIQDAVNYRE
jgi:hypothetical protein